VRRKSFQIREKKISGRGEEISDQQWVRVGIISCIYLGIYHDSRNDISTNQKEN
jgi:hypothetical protein